MKALAYSIFTGVVIIGFGLLLLVFSHWSGETVLKAVKTPVLQPENPDRILKTTFDQKDNLFCVIYIENGDTIGLDHIYPIEFDSLVNSLNKPNPYKSHE